MAKGDAHPGERGCKDGDGGCHVVRTRVSRGVLFFLLNSLRRLCICEVWNGNETYTKPTFPTA